MTLGWNALICIGQAGNVIAAARYGHTQVAITEVPSRDLWRARTRGAPSPMTGEVGQYVPCVTDEAIAASLDKCWQELRAMHDTGEIPAEWLRSAGPIPASPPAPQVNIAEDQIVQVEKE